MPLGEAIAGTRTDRAQEQIARHFDAFAAEEDRWLPRTPGYHELIRRLYRAPVPPGSSVLEVGCGSGDLLACLRCSRGVGVDISPAMIERAQRRHPELKFVVSAGESLDLGETFDYIVLSDLVPY